MFWVVMLNCVDPTLTLPRLSPICQHEFSDSQIATFENPDDLLQQIPSTASAFSAALCPHEMVQPVDLFVLGRVDLILSMGHQNCAVG